MVRTYIYSHKLLCFDNDINGRQAVGGIKVRKKRQNLFRTKREFVRDIFNFDTPQCVGFVKLLNFLSNKRT